MLRLTLVIVALFVSISNVDGHGRLLDPPSRSSLWRFYDDIGAAINYQDNELFCGGFALSQHSLLCFYGEIIYRGFNVQFRHKIICLGTGTWDQVQQANDGKCGTCGDPYDGERENEAGGKYAIGFISRTYEEGQEIDVTVQLTASHKGSFWFKICPHNDVHTPVSQQCLDLHPLEIVGQTDEKYRFTVPPESGYYYIKLKLPAGVTCSQCVFQWHYKAGNSYGCDPDGTCCLGCGPQETFINCADISIVEKGGATNSPFTLPTVTATPWVPKSSSSQTVAPTDAPTTQEPPASSDIPTTQEPPVSSDVPTTHEPPVTTVRPPATSTSATGSIVKCNEIDTVPECKGIGVPQPTDSWCTQVCRAGLPDCSPVRCDCTCVKQTVCVPVGQYDEMPGMIDWCNQNCAHGACPDSSICQCTCS